MFARVEIIAIGNEPLKSTFNGVIRRENARSYDIEGIDLFKCFIPNDIVRARVLTQQGSGNQSSMLLSTAEDEMGVIFARSEESGNLMIPRSWTEF